MGSTPLDRELAKLAAYRYLEEAITGKAVLELGHGTGWGARVLSEMGASRGLTLDVSGGEAVDDDWPIQRWRPPRLPFADRSFDTVLLGEPSLCRRYTGLIAEARRVLRPGGLLAIVAENGDEVESDDALEYGEVLELVEPHFEAVRVLGQSAFAGCSLVELVEGPSDDLEISLDGALMQGQVEAVGYYVTLCGEPALEAQALSYGIIQLPTGGLDALAEAAEAEYDEAEETDDEIDDEIDSDEEILAAEATEEEATVDEGTPDGVADDAVMDAPGDDADETDASPSPLAEALGHEFQPPTGVDDLRDSAGGLLTRWRWPRFVRR